MRSALLSRCTTITARSSIYGAAFARDHPSVWRQDTLVNVSSTTKGVASLTVAVAVSRGLISYDAKMADYWPKFAQAGKDAITVRHLLAHQGGLSAIKPLLTQTDLAEPTKMSAKLAAQAPAWTPGTRHGYHSYTLGWYEGELIRRVDPAGRPLGRFFADEIAKPLGLDFYIGLPTAVNRDRVAHLNPLPDPSCCTRRRLWRWHRSTRSA